MTALLEQHDRWQGARSRLGLPQISRPIRLPPIVLPLEKRVERHEWDTAPIAPYDEYTEPARKVAKPRWTVSSRLPLWRQVLCDVANAHGIDPDSILQRGKSRPRVEARNDLCWRLYRKTSLSASEISRRVGLEESTVRHGIRSHQKRLDKGLP